MQYKSTRLERERNLRGRRGGDGGAACGERTAAALREQRGREEREEEIKKPTTVYVCLSHTGPFVMTQSRRLL
jgi:hypothetical protein